MYWVYIQYVYVDIQSFFLLFFFKYCRLSIPSLRCSMYALYERANIYSPCEWRHNENDFSLIYKYLGECIFRVFFPLLFVFPAKNVKRIKNRAKKKKTSHNTTFLVWNSFLWCAYMYVKYHYVIRKCAFFSFFSLLC